MSGFNAQYEPLSNLSPQWGTIALLPWDAKIFGFPVADYQPGPRLPEMDSLPEFRETLTRFSQKTHAELISTRCPAASTKLSAFLFMAGFFPVDLTFDVEVRRLQFAKLPEPRFSLRPAETDDFESICRIAGSAFQFGRYHTDPRFPRELADRRYIQWMKSALAQRDANQEVWVLGALGRPIGFLHVALEDGVADLRLGAVDPDETFGFAGFSLYAESLRALRERAARCAKARISAANTRVVNVYAALGFQFSKPETVFHWHAPGAQHMDQI